MQAYSLQALPARLQHLLVIWNLSKNFKTNTALTVCSQDKSLRIYLYKDTQHCFVGFLSHKDGELLNPFLLFWPWHVLGEQEFALSQLEFKGMLMWHVLKTCPSEGNAPQHRWNWSIFLLTEEAAQQLFGSFSWKSECFSILAHSLKDEFPSTLGVPVL